MRRSITVIFAVLVVVVLVDLAHVVRRIADDDRDRRLLLPLDALGVLLGHEAELPLLLFRQIERVHEAQPLERLVLAGPLVVRVLDVQRRDVVRQQHHLVGEELLAVDARQVSSWGCGGSG